VIYHWKARTYTYISRYLPNKPWYDISLIYIKYFVRVLSTIFMPNHLIHSVLNARGVLISVYFGIWYSRIWITYLKYFIIICASYLILVIDNLIKLFVLFSGTYDLPFLLAGVPPIIGALTMFLIRCVKENNEGSLNDSENIPSKTDCQNGR